MPFQPVADFEPVFPVLHGDNEQDAVVLALLAELPFLLGLKAKLLDALAVQGLDREDQHLGGRLPLQLPQQCHSSLLSFGWLDDSGKVHDIIARHGRRLGR